jgi:AcrR family transcriptional regulator
MLTELLPGLLVARLTATDPADDEILDAALVVGVAFGLRRTTMDEVARRAGVGRMTVYRRFGTKEELLRRLIVREAYRLVVAVGDATKAEPNLADRIVAGFVTVLRLTRDHPLIDRLVHVEPDVLTELSTLEHPDLVGLGRAFIAAELRRAKADGTIADVDPDQVAEVVVRLVISFVVLPRSVVDVTDDAAARAFARSVLVPILTGGTPGPKARR